VDARALAELDQLDHRDRELAASAAELLELEAAVARIRERAQAVDRFFAAYRDDEVRLAAAIEAGVVDVDRRKVELATAERELAAGRADDDRERAEKAVVRAGDRVALAESALERARSAHGDLERAAAALPAELTALEAEAVEIAATADLPEAGAEAGPAGLADWASRSHAELFIARTQIDTQRERIIREANELASMLLGEPTHGSTVAQALRQVRVKA
jgi:chromosome segregation protein